MENSTSKLDHVNFTVDSYSQSIAWYKNVFRFLVVEEGLDSDGNKWGILRSGDSMLAITENTQCELLQHNRYHRVRHIGLRLKNTKEWEALIESNNIELYFNSPIQYPSSTSWYVKDPTGNDIEVSIWKGDSVHFDS